MLDIKTFQFNMFSENTYVVSDDTKECVVIDCGALYPVEREALMTYIRVNGLKPVLSVATHGHLDHWFGNRLLMEEYGLEPWVGCGDENQVLNIRKSALEIFGIKSDEEPAPVGRYLKEGDVLMFGTHEMRAISTPGHSPGCMVFYCEEEDVAFTGDTLFQMSIGRTDFPEGSMEEMTRSLSRLTKELPDETTIYPGHGPSSTMRREKACNPYLY